MLSDKDQRAVYDEQGVVDEELDALKHDRNWEEHWRRLFPKVWYSWRSLKKVWAFLRLNTTFTVSVFYFTLN